MTCHFLAIVWGKKNLEKRQQSLPKFPESEWVSNAERQGVQKVTGTLKLSKWKPRWYSSYQAKVGTETCVHVRECNKSVTGKHRAVFYDRTLVLKGSGDWSQGKCHKFGAGT